MSRPGSPGQTVLVTGGAGFVGRHIVDALCMRGDHVVVLDTAGASPAEARERALPAGTPINVVGDVTDIGAVVEVVEREGVNAIIHAAGLVGEPPSLLDPRRYLRINADAVWDLCESLRGMSGIRRTVVLSSRSVYGAYRPDEGPVAEDAVPRPVAFYGIAKAAADLVIAGYRSNFGVDVVSARITGPYGAGQRYPTPVGDMLAAAVSRTPYRRASGADDRYETVYIKDTVRGILTILDAPILRYPVYNVGTGRLDTLRSVAEALRRIDPCATIDVGPGTADEVPRASMSIERIRHELGFEPVWTLGGGLEDAVRVMRCSQRADAASAPRPRSSVGLREAPHGPPARTESGRVTEPEGRQR